MNKKGQRIFGLGSLVGGFIAIGIGIWMYPILIEQLDIAASASNNVTNIPVSGSANTILGLIPLFFALGILAFALNLVMSGLRNVGVLGGSSDDEDKEEEEEEEEEEEDEEYESKCDYCGKEINEDDEYECDKCEENICMNCRIKIGDEDYCRECYDKKKQRMERIKQESKKEIVKEEVKPIITEGKTSFEKKSKFEEKTKYD
ncbi:hypothetical protein LCGC14_2826390 [marine sediment metagenome]|uniref:Uncharacterized protein n=1 Tax=marine sediment metagenome TaxID=412755 RepID=A0A0F9ANU0_9ZZZZ